MEPINPKNEVPESVPFYKMSGCGNDFIVFDNRELNIPESVMGAWAKNLCRRGFAIGADGLFFLDRAETGSSLAYRWHFFNSDGSTGEMCGNASRCAAKLAHMIGLAPPEHVFGTVAGPIHAKVLLEGPGAGKVRVRLTPPLNLRTHQRIPLNGDMLTCHYIVVGVPHVVIWVDDIGNQDVCLLGSRIRHHDAFSPVGANVNFAQIVNRDTILLRTYERGVENETHACGTGAAATQYVAHRLSLTDASARLTTSGGEVLTISLKDDNIFLQGNADLIFKGVLFTGILHPT